MTGSVNQQSNSAVWTLYTAGLRQSCMGYCAHVQMWSSGKKKDILKATPTLFTSCKFDEGQWAKTHKIKLIAQRSRKKVQSGF